MVEFYVKKWPCLARFFMINFIMSICDHSGNRVVFVMRIFQGHMGIVRFVRGPGAGGGGCERVGETILQIQSMAGLPGGLFCFSTWAMRTLRKARESCASQGISDAAEHQ